MSELHGFLREIAAMTLDGEERPDDEPFEMENDDAVETLCSLISRARELIRVGDPAQAIISFMPDAIREHYECCEPDPVEGLSDEVLREVGVDACERFQDDDGVWNMFSACLDEAVEKAKLAQ